MPFSAKAVPLFLVFSLSMLFGCAKTVPQPSQPARMQSESVTNIPQAPPAAEIPKPSGAPQAKPEAKLQSAEEPPCLECEAASPGQDRADCFKLQPGKTTKNSRARP